MLAAEPGMARSCRTARPGLADDHRDAGAALAHVPDHRPLVLAGGRVGLEGGPDRVVGHHGRLLVGAAGGRRH